MDLENLKQELNNLAEAALADKDLKAQLCHNPESVLAEKRIELPRDKQIKAVLQDDKLALILLPIEVNADELSLEELEMIAGGSICNSPFGMLGEGYQK